MVRLGVEPSALCALRELCHCRRPPPSRGDEDSPTGRLCSSLREVEAEVVEVEAAAAAAEAAAVCSSREGEGSLAFSSLVTVFSRFLPPRPLPGLRESTAVVLLRESSRYSRSCAATSLNVGRRNGSCRTMALMISVGRGARKRVEYLCQCRSLSERSPPHSQPGSKPTLESRGNGPRVGKALSAPRRAARRLKRWPDALHCHVEDILGVDAVRLHHTLPRLDKAEHVTKHDPRAVHIDLCRHDVCRSLSLRCAERRGWGCYGKFE